MPTIGPKEQQRELNINELIKTGAYPSEPSELSSLFSIDLCPRRRSGREWAGTTWGGGRSPLGLADLILSRSEMLSLETKEVGLWDPEKPRPLM